MVECSTVYRVVVGSNPVNTASFFFSICAVGQAVKSSPFHGEDASSILAQRINVALNWAIVSPFFIWLVMCGRS